MGTIVLDPPFFESSGTCVDSVADGVSRRRRAAMQGNFGPKAARSGRHSSRIE